MTTIPGQNIVIQQSGAVHEATHHVKPNQPLPEQLAGMQAAREEQQKSSVQGTEKGEKLKQEKEKELREREKRNQARKKRAEERNRRNKSKKGGADGSTGSLLNTVV